MFHMHHHSAQVNVRPQKGLNDFSRTDRSGSDCKRCQRIRHENLLPVTQQECAQHLVTLAVVGRRRVWLSTYVLQRMTVTTVPQVRPLGTIAV